MSVDFTSIALPDSVMRGIQAAGFTTCTPIQEEVLPITLRGRDVAGQAQTGTGKTAAFFPPSSGTLPTHSFSFGVLLTTCLIKPGRPGPYC